MSSKIKSAKIKSTVKIIREQDIPLPPPRPRAGWSGPFNAKPLIGRQTPTERIQMGHPYFGPHVHEPLHWHVYEVAYYVLSGKAYVGDINGNKYTLEAGDLLYASPGIASSHSWDSKDTPFELIGMMPSTEPKLQFDIIDETTKQSSIEFNTMMNAGQVIFSKHSLWGEDYSPQTCGAKPILKIIHDKDVPLPPWKPRPGWTGVQRVKRLIGPQTPTERFQIMHAYFEPHTHEPLHWHMTEVAYYVLSGVAYPYDINGKTYELGPGSILYAGPGMVGAHSWVSKEKPFELLVVRANSNPEQTYPQFNIYDEKTKQSFVEYDSVVSSGNKRSLW